MADKQLIVFSIGFIGTALTMALHLVGLTLNWWPIDHITFYPPFIFMAMAQLGVWVGE